MFGHRPGAEEYHPVPEGMKDVDGEGVGVLAVVLVSVCMCQFNIDFFLSSHKVQSKIQSFNISFLEHYCHNVSTSAFSILQMGTKCFKMNVVGQIMTKLLIERGNN